MSIAVVKVGKKLDTDFKRSAGDSREIVGFMKLAESHGKKVWFFDGKDDKRLEETTSVIIFPGIVDFIGGAINEKLIADYKFIRKAQDKGIKCIVMNVDWLIPMFQLGDLSKRPWYEPSMSVVLDSMIYLTQSDEPEALKVYYESKKNVVGIKKMVRVPLEKLFTFSINEPTEGAEKSVDFAYIGNRRNGQRLKKMKQFYENSGAHIYGNWKGDELAGVEFKGKLNNNRVFEVLSSSFSTIVIHDVRAYRFKFKTQRFCEALVANCVPLVDRDYDPDFALCSKELGLHVGSAEEARQAVHKLKSSSHLEYSNLLSTLCKKALINSDELWGYLQNEVC